MRNETVLRQDRMRTLREALGLVEAEKFIMLMKRDPFDYTEWQAGLWKDKTVEEVFLAAKEYEMPQGENA